MKTSNFCALKVRQLQLLRCRVDVGKGCLLHHSFHRNSHVMLAGNLTLRLKTLELLERRTKFKIWSCSYGWNGLALRCKHLILGFWKPLRGYYDQCEPSKMSEQDSNITFQFLARVKLLNIAFWSIHQYRLSWYAQFCPSKLMLPSWAVAAASGSSGHRSPIGRTFPCRKAPLPLLQQHHGPLPFAGCTAGTDGWVKRYLDGFQRCDSAPWGNPPWKVNSKYM